MHATARALVEVCGANVGYPSASGSTKLGPDRRRYKSNNPGVQYVVNQTSAHSAPGGRFHSAAWVGGPDLVYLFGGRGYANALSFGFLNGL